MFTESMGGRSRKSLSPGALPVQKILVVDDEAGIRSSLQTALSQMGFSVTIAESGEQALHIFRQNSNFSIVISDYKMPGLTGFDVMKEVKTLSPSTRFILMTGYGSVHHAVSAMQQGADEYLCKPFELSDLEKILQRQTLTTEVQETVAITSGARRLITADPQMTLILRKAERAARSTAPVLIEGPSGTGKELLARQIHDWSPRKDKPWIAINCAALPAGLLESELFGFERGAFTGANERKQGRFEQAHGGTLLLDEIGELDPLLQAKLLRALQEGEIDRLGGKKSVKVDVRVIATTNRNLEQLVSEDRFREDLFFRLYGVRFQLPALKDRPADIRILSQKFLERQTEIHHKEFVFAEGVRELLEQSEWQGNVRELERAIERACILSEDGVIRIDNFEFAQSRRRKLSSRVVKNESLGERAEPSSSRSIREMEREIILSALESHGGNRTHTAKALGMSLRTLRHKIKMYRDEGHSVEEPTRQKEPITSCRVPVPTAPLAPHFSASEPGLIFARQNCGEVSLEKM